SESRKRDALTLWHLLSRADDEQRMAVYEHLRALVPPPANVTKEGVLRLDQVMLDRWWNELGFDDISVWRHWERSWSATAIPQQKVICSIPANFSLVRVVRQLVNSLLSSGVS